MRRKNTRRIDPRYFLNETVERSAVHEAMGEGSSAEKVAADVKRLPLDVMGAVIDDFQNMAAGDTSMVHLYPTAIEDPVSFAEEVLDLLLEK